MARGRIYQSPFTPADITTNGWWDVSDNQQLQNSGVVTSISDKSGNGITLSQLIWYKYTLILQNGLDVIVYGDRYNGSEYHALMGYNFIVCRVDVIDNGLDSNSLLQPMAFSYKQSCPFRAVFD